MPATPDELFASLDRLGIAHPTVTPSAAVHGRAVAGLRGTIPGGHTKNLFLKDKKDALFLVTALEDAAIELKSLHRRLGATGRFSFGSADLMRETLGVDARRGDAVRRHQRHRPPRHRRARCGLDGARRSSTRIRWSTP